MPGSKTDESFKNGEVSQSSKGKVVGPQGTGGRVSGQEIMGVSNPRGMNAKKIGGARMPLSQGPVEPKVGK